MFCSIKPHHTTNFSAVQVCNVVTIALQLHLTDLVPCVACCPCTSATSYQEIKCLIEKDLQAREVYLSNIPRVCNYLNLMCRIFKFHPQACLPLNLYLRNILEYNNCASYLKVLNNLQLLVPRVGLCFDPLTLCARLADMWIH